MRLNIVMIQNLGSRYQDVIDEVEQRQLSFLDVERHRLSFTHCQVSKLLLEQWSFPGSLIDAVESHHTEVNPEDKSPTTVGDIVQLANHLGKRENIGFSDFVVSDLSRLKIVHKLGLDSEWCEDLILEITEHYTSEARIFEEA